MRIDAQQNEANLQLSMAALRAQVSSLDMRRRQAEEMAQLLMNQTFTKEELASLVLDKLVEHMDKRDTERSQHFLAVIQTTLIGLSPLAQSTADQRVKQHLVEIIKALTLTLEAGK